MKEIEILMEVKSSKDKALKMLNRFTAHGLKHTIDVYFFDPLRKDLQPNKSGRLDHSFRLREKDGKATIAYKIDHFEDGEWVYSDEHEVAVADFAVAKDILNHLGLKTLVSIDNEKHVFMVADYEIVLEDVKGLGLFLEVEKITQVSDDRVQETKEEIRSFLKKLPIEFGEEQNAGKPELMLRKAEGLITKEL